jgi:hypothetical protein
MARMIKISDITEDGKENNVTSMDTSATIMFGASQAYGFLSRNGYSVEEIYNIADFLKMMADLDC